MIRIQEKTKKQIFVITKSKQRNKQKHETKITCYQSSDEAFNTNIWTLEKED